MCPLNIYRRNEADLFICWLLSIECSTLDACTTSTEEIDKISLCVGAVLACLYTSAPSAHTHTHTHTPGCNAMQTRRIFNSRRIRTTHYHSVNVANCTWPIRKRFHDCVVQPTKMDGAKKQKCDARTVSHNSVLSISTDRDINKSCAIFTESAFSILSLAISSWMYYIIFFFFSFYRFVCAPDSQSLIAFVYLF